MKKYYLILILIWCEPAVAEDYTYPSNLVGSSSPEVDYGFQPGDFNQPPPDEVRMADIRRLTHKRNEIHVIAQNCPDDATGKRSTWYASLQNWFVEYAAFKQSKKRQDLRNLMDNIAQVCGMPSGFAGGDLKAG